MPESPRFFPGFPDPYGWIGSGQNRSKAFRRLLSRQAIRIIQPVKKKINCAFQVCPDDLRPG